MMLRFWLALGFALLFPIHPLAGLGLIVLLVAWTQLTRLAARRLPVLAAKDLVFVLYALAALPAVLLDPSQGILWARVIVYPWLITLAFQNLGGREREVWPWLSALYVAMLGAAAIMLFQVEPGHFDFSYTRLASLDRQQGFYFTSDKRLGPNIASYCSAAAVVLALVRLRFRRGPALLNAAAIAVPAVLLFVSGSRNAWVASVLCFTLYLFYRPQGLQLHRPLAVRALRIALAALAVIFAGVLLAQSVVAGQENEAVRRLQAMIDPASDHNVKFRMVYWGLASVMIRQRPLGWGYGAFNERYGFSTHNELLGQLVGGGWLATAAFFLLLGMVWWHVVRMRRNTPAADAVRFASLCLLSVVCLAMVTENVTVSLMNTYMPLFWTVIGLSYGVHHYNGVQQRLSRVAANPRDAAARGWRPPRQRQGRFVSRD